MVSTNFTLAEIEAASAEVFRIASGHRSKLTARLRKFHKLGMLAERRDGRQGVVGRYALDDALRHIVALELTDCGLTPDKVLVVLDVYWGDFQSIFRVIAQGMIPRVMYGVLQPNCLRPLMKGEVPEASLVFVQNIGDALPFGGAIVLNVSGLLAKGIQALEGYADRSGADMLREVAGA